LEDTTPEVAKWMVTMNEIRQVGAPNRTREVVPRMPPVRGSVFNRLDFLYFKTMRLRLGVGMILLYPKKRQHAHDQYHGIETKTEVTAVHASLPYELIGRGGNPISEIWLNMSRAVSYSCRSGKPEFITHSWGHGWLKAVRCALGHQA
jgi:hypothetical protein